MTTVLILGNGISRLEFDKEIRAFTGPVWGCNRAYIDYGDILSALAGHTDVMEEARDHGDYKIFGQDEAFTCPDIYRKDTGSMLVAEALTRGYDVICVGFDLGGADVYSPGHDKKNKTTWVNRWRLILSVFDHSRVTFWGYDHKPFILSHRPANEYALKYTRGDSHIPTDGYKKVITDWKNDYSRVWETIPKVYIKNVGSRDWEFHESPEILKVGERIKMPECVARKYVELYRKEFVIEPIIDMVV
jgi:hypothetical protein